MFKIEIHGEYTGLRFTLFTEYDTEEAAERVISGIKRMNPGTTARNYSVVEVTE